jgi:hypothetical protein
MARKSTEIPNSRYVQGGKTQQLANRLGWWERKIIPTDSTDERFIITAKYSKRPDLLAAHRYGKSSLGWVILQLNNIIDINTEFVEGQTILLPTPSRVFYGILKDSV